MLMLRRKYRAKHIMKFNCSGCPLGTNTSNKPTLYAVSQREPQDISELWEVHPNEYRPKLIAGQKLASTLRANPIRSKRDEDGKQHRHDVIITSQCALPAGNILTHIVLWGDY